jgi:hypothetical protein
MGLLEKTKSAMDSAGAKMTPQGIAIFEGISLFAGVLPYVLSEAEASLDGGNPGDVVGVVSLPEDLFDEESLCSLVGVGVYLGHPSEMSTDLSNAVGLVLSAEPESEFDEKTNSFNYYVELKLGIWDRDAIEYIQAGNKELSAGYTATFTKESGLWAGSPYWYKKENIEYNHIAILPPDSARNGTYSRIVDTKLSKISLDVNLSIVDSNNVRITKSLESLSNMEKIILANGKEVAIAPESKQILLDYLSSFAELSSQVTDAKSAVADREELSKKLQASEQEIQKLKSSVITQEELQKQIKRGASVAYKAEKLGISVDYSAFDPDIIIRSTLKEKGYNVDDEIPIQVLEYAFQHIPLPEVQTSTPAQTETTDAKPKGSPISLLKKAMDNSKPEISLEDYTADALSQATFNQRKRNKAQ